MGVLITSPSGAIIVDRTTGRVNLESNPRFVSNTGWSGAAGHSWGANFGEFIVGASPMINGTSFAFENGGIPAVGGVYYVASRKVTVPAGQPAVSLSLAVVHYGGGVSNPNYSPIVTIQPGTSATLVTPTTYLAPAGTNLIRSVVYLRDANAPAGSRMIFSEALVERADTIGPYFDGNFPDAGPVDYAWSSTPNSSPSLQLLPVYAGVPSSAPDLALGYEAARPGRNVFHDILDREDPDATLRKPSLRQGTLNLLYQDEGPAWDGFNLHAQLGTFTLTDTDRPRHGMTYLLDGDLGIALDEDTADDWIVSVPYREVRP